MKKRAFLLVIFFALAFLPILSAQELKQVPYVEKKVVIVEVKDGDTLVAKGGLVIRLLGVNTPEKGWPYSEEATEFVKEKVMGKKVLLKISKKYPRDKYGRILAVLYNWKTERNKQKTEKDGSRLTALCSLNLKLIQVGLGKVLIEDNDLVNVPFWKAVQEKAKQKKRGIWGVPK